MEVSEHARERLKERCGFNKKPVKEWLTRHLRREFLTAEPKAD